MKFYPVIVTSKTLWGLLLYLPVIDIFTDFEYGIICLKLFLYFTGVPNRTLIKRKII